jgi:2-polyprenyl-3-methyl-5-hydroxy-6-metoxy-1,4-benzoquinol methylase
MENTNENYVYTDHLRSEILNMVPKNGQVIGSIGCGQARTEGALVQAGREVHGVDVSERAIEVAKQRITSAKVIKGDELMPFAEGSLDGLLLLDVLEHLPLAWERLSDYVKMVKKGGWVVISVPNMRHIEILTKLVLKGDWPEDEMGIFDKTHIQVMTHKRLKRWGDIAGLEHQSWHNAYRWAILPHYFYQALDLITFKFFKSFFHYQILAVFTRK